MNRYYFDHNATTPITEEILEVHLEALREVYGNASSIHHAGQQARQRLEHARRQLAALINADSKEIVFTSGGTEANNLAIFGVARGRAHVITTSIEHPAVLQPCAQLAREGVEVTVVPVNGDGVVDPEEIRRAIRPDTALISVMHVNNELGTIQPVPEIAAIAREAGVTMHCDGVQSTGRIPVDLRALGVDLFTASAHKMYAPKGVGMLYVRKDSDLRPLMFGGRHENGLRPGTENVPSAVAFGAGASTATPDFDSTLRDRLEARILDRIPDVRINGAKAKRAPNTSNVCLQGIEGEAVVIALDLKGFAVSSGAACSSGAVEPSHVLTAIGLSRKDARSCVRISLGRGNTAEQVDALADALEDVAGRLRRLSTDYVTHA